MPMASPSFDLVVKLSAIAQMVDEASVASNIDLDRARGLLADRDVAQWLDVMHREGFLTEQVSA